MSMMMVSRHAHWRRGGAAHNGEQDLAERNPVHKWAMPRHSKITVNGNSSNLHETWTYPARWCGAHHSEQPRTRQGAQ